MELQPCVPVNGTDVNGIHDLNSCLRPLRPDLPSSSSSSAEKMEKQEAKKANIINESVSQLLKTS